MKRLVSFILVLILLFSLGISASATWGIEAKELYYRGISIYVNGTELIPQDVNGKSTEPFIIEGTTYLPVRALAGALGLSVGWDGTTNTITLTSGAEVNMGSGQAAKTKEIVNADVYYKDVKIFLDGAELIPTDVTGKYVEPFLMGGSTYLPLRAIATALGLEVGWDETTNTITLDTPAEDPTGMAWRLVKQTVTTTAYNGSIVFPDVVLETEYLYNELGRFLGMFMSLSDFRILDINCTYDQSGRLETLTMLTEDEELVISFSYSDSDGFLSDIKATMNGEFVAESTFVCNSAGRIILEFVKDADGTLVHTVNYQYDDNGNCVREETTKMTLSDPFAVIAHVERSFDDAGRLLSEFSYVGDKLESSTCYTYDENGNVLTFSHTSDETVLSFSYQYDDQGREISSTVTIDGLTSTSVTVWAEDGLSCVVTTSSAGSVSTETLTWNEEGLLVLGVLEQDNVTIVTEYEYALFPSSGEDELLNQLLGLLGYSR